MKKVYYAHPLMILMFAKPFLFVLVIPFIRGFLQYITDKRVTSLLGIELFLIITIAIVSVLKSHAFRFIIVDDNITIRKGFLIKTKAKIKLSQISSIQSEQNPLDAVLGAVTYHINTEAGRKNKPDFKFKISLKDSREISSILYGTQPNERVRFSALRVAIMAATTSSAFTGMVIGVPIIKKTGDLLGIALDKMLFDEINNVSNKYADFIPPVVNTVTLILLLSYVVAFLYSFFKYMNFRLFLGEDKTEIRSGLFVRSRLSFRKSSVNNVRIEQTPLMQLLRRYAMKVSVGGYGDSKSESQVVVPADRKSEIFESFNTYFPYLKPKGNEVTPPRSAFTESRFLFWPMVWFLTLTGLATGASLRFVNFGRLILFTAFIALGIILIYARLSIYEYHSCKMQLGKTVSAYSTRWLRTYGLCCVKENVGEIKISRFFRDFDQNTCRVRITVRSEAADSIRIRCLDYKKTLKEISDAFNVQV